MAEEFGRLLRRLRKERGKTLRELSDHLGKSVSYISDVERGQRAPFSSDLLRSTADFFSVDPRELVVAADVSRGAFRLDADGVSQKAREVGAALQRGWSGLSDQKLEALRRVLEEGEE